MKDIDPPVTDLCQHGDSYRLNDSIGELQRYPRHPDAIRCRQMRLGPIVTSAGRQFHNT